MISKRRAKKCLQELAAIINESGRHGDAVRDIVSALRGPDGMALDYHDTEVKDRTTAIIRRQIGLGGNCGLIVAPSGASLAKVYRAGSGPIRPIPLDNVNTPHFVGHIRRAWAALELLGIAEKELLPARAAKKKVAK